MGRRILESLRLHSREPNMAFIESYYEVLKNVVPKRRAVIEKCVRERREREHHGIRIVYWGNLEIGVSRVYLSVT